MPAIKPVPYRTLAKILKSEGFTLHRQRGDHPFCRKPEVKRPLVIPMYCAVPVFVIENLLRTAGMARERYFSPLGKVLLTDRADLPTARKRAALTLSSSQDTRISPYRIRMAASRGSSAIGFHERVIRAERRNAHKPPTMSEYILSQPSSCPNNRDHPSRQQRYSLLAPSGPRHRQ